MKLKNQIRYYLGQLVERFGFDLRPSWKTPAGSLHPLRMATELLLARQQGELDILVQVGVFDGVTDDPLAPKLLETARSIFLVEPQPSCVDILRRRYGSDGRISVVAAALAEQEGELTLWSESDISQRASLKKAHVEKFASGKAPVAHTVKCITPVQLHEMLGFKTPDLLQVDTEGMDWAIVKGLLAVGCLPRVLNFENFHLTESDRLESRHVLASHNYSFIEYGLDTCAVHESLFA
jgi:FkbM family methyltransferase